MRSSKKLSTVLIVIYILSAFLAKMRVPKPDNSSEVSGEKAKVLPARSANRKLSTPICYIGTEKSASGYPFPQRRS